MNHSAQRRWFLRAIAALVNVAVGAALAIPGIRFVTASLRRRGTEQSFVRVALLESVPFELPFRAPVVMVRRDAFVRFPPGPIGNVWLFRQADVDGTPRLQCWQTICPHLGCGIDFSKEADAFNCPCHAAEFDKSGRRTSGPSPRDMDRLECRVAAPDEEGKRWVEVRYHRFEPGVANRRVLG